MHEVIHYFYSGWLDHQTPEKSRGILELVRQVSVESEPQINGPVIVHCRLLFFLNFIIKSSNLKSYC